MTAGGDEHFHAYPSHRDGHVDHRRKLRTSVIRESAATGAWPSFPFRRSSSSIFPELPTGMSPFATVAMHINDTGKVAEQACGAALHGIRGIVNVFGDRAGKESSQSEKSNKMQVKEYTTAYGDCTLTFQLDSTKQHTLSWRAAIELPQIEGEPPTARLEPGTCNIYTFPRVQLDSMPPGKTVLLKGPLLRTLSLSLLAAALADGSSLLEQRDDVGANPIHGLLVANSDSAVEVVMQVIHLRPAIMLQCHEGQPFAGENVLHILIVNRREAAVCELLELAFTGKGASRFMQSSQFEGFSRGQLEGLLWSQCIGVFFHEKPMVYYGGTPLSYAVAFSLEVAISKLLMLAHQTGGCDGLVDLNGERSACTLTGFYPIHVAVANGLTSMFNFLVDLPGLPLSLDARRAKKDLHTRRGGMLPVGLGLLTPLQAAAKLGDHRMLQYILRSQSKINWVWGPVTEFHLDLCGIDSIGETANDVMELCARIGALAKTQQMLLDDFMQGFIHNLFLQKWRKFGRQMHYVMRVCDLVYLGLLAYLAFLMKASPTSPDVRDTLPYFVMVSVLPIMLEDFRTARVWWLDYRGRPGHRLRLSLDEVWPLLVWMESHQMGTRFVGFVLTFSVCAPLITIQRDDFQPHEWGLGQQLDPLWVPLAFALFFHTQNAARSFLAPSQTMGVFYISVFKMLSTDVTHFILLFLIFLGNYGTAMYLSYPRAGAQSLPQVMSFNHPLDALNSLVTLAFTGDPLPLDLDRDNLAELSDAEAVSFWFFVFFYLFYVVMAMILLLNLLIAMMGDTYSGTMETSTLEWRVSFARRVLRLELESRVLRHLFNLELHAGTKIGDEWFYVYRKYEPNEEGGGMGNQSSMFAADVEAEAEADEEDDERTLGEDSGLPERTSAEQVELSIARRISESDTRRPSAAAQPRHAVPEDPDQVVSLEVTPQVEAEGSHDPSTPPGSEKQAEVSEL